MMSGMYAAISGLSAHQTMLDVIGNNLSNVDTVGYKAQRTTFVDELAQLVHPASAASSLLGGSNPVQIGLGVQIGSIDNMMGAGSLENTGNATDVAIQGDGFLTVQAGSVSAAGSWSGPTPPPAGTDTYTQPKFQAAAGPVQYTRAGNLTLTPWTDPGSNSTNSYLTTQSGQYVLGYPADPISGLINPNGPKDDGNNIGKVDPTVAPATPIEIPAMATNVQIANNGAVTYTDGNPADDGTGTTPNTYNTTVTAGYISLATMTNEAGMQRDGSSLWTPTTNTGPTAYGQPGTGNVGKTLSGQLEMSNVDMATEFTNMIQAQRGYQANASTVTTADQMLQTVVQMKQG